MFEPMAGQLARAQTDDRLRNAHGARYRRAARRRRNFRLAVASAIASFGRLFEPKRRVEATPRLAAPRREPVLPG